MESLSLTLTEWVEFLSCAHLRVRALGAAKGYLGKGSILASSPLTIPAPLLAIATTPAALRSLVPYCAPTQTPLLIPAALEPYAQDYAATGLTWQVYGQGDGESLRTALGERWPDYAGFIFALATGAVVRLIAPLLGHKSSDPAIVVVDGATNIALSLCSGHQGGADALTQQVSQYLDSTPIITGGAQQRAIPPVDLWGKPFGWQRGAGNWTAVSSALAQGQSVQVVQTAGSDLWWRWFPQRDTSGITVQATVPNTPANNPAARVYITLDQAPQGETTLPTVVWHPRLLWLGIGCERHSDRDLISWAIDQVLAQRGWAKAAIAGVASVDVKGDEPGLVALCRDRQWPFRTFSPETLAAIPVPNPSAIVAQAVGTPSVAEAAAIAAANPADPQSLRLEKQIFRHPQYSGAVTIAVAQAPQEWLGSPGHLALIGTGPGDLGQLTAAAKGAIAQADVVIGYGLYLDLIRPLLRPGQGVEAFPITQEQQRADRAIALARWGLSVAVISSGDCGIYAMAGLVLETLEAQGWDGHTPAVTSYPGISALQAAAARVGAPLMHDFCAISLSDLLTPWPVIETRLIAAAAADFVVALYNPKSQKRTHQIEIAHRHFLAHRPPTTPVAIVRSAYRLDEHITLTTLADLLQHPIDMLTVLLIGNRTTHLYQGKLITPRGYPVTP